MRLMPVAPASRERQCRQSPSLGGKEDEMDGPDQHSTGDGQKPSPRSKPRVDKEARKADYLRAAARAFLAKGAAASMQDVADSAGAPKPVW